MGTGTDVSKHFRSRPSIAGILRRAGTSTPHSQLRQLSLGSFVTRSLTSLPHALSEQFADPTYAHDLDGSSSVRTNSSCSNKPENGFHSIELRSYLVMHKHTCP